MYSEQFKLLLKLCRIFSQKRHNETRTQSVQMQFEWNSKYLIENTECALKQPQSVHIANSTAQHKSLKDH